MEIIRQPSPVNRRRTLCPPHRSVASEATKQFYVCFDDVVIQNGSELRLGVHSNVQHEFFVSLLREDVVKMFFASPVERMRSCVLGGAEELYSTEKAMIGRK